MVPRKHVLLVGTDEVALGILFFAFENRGHYRVVRAPSTKEALEMVRGHKFELLIVKGPLPPSFLLLRRINLIDPDMKRIYLAADAQEYERARQGFQADAVLLNPPMMDLLERMRILTKRRRGPRRGYRKPPLPEWFMIPARKQATV